ncbi:hypothetical protein K440DRAFT_627205 [Wilcoxina mikolae CBS 423.85]|nr:hypothetical protein K440DRAFT_627205 [Wilcoxina mikolae CBS 423.85]
MDSQAASNTLHVMHGEPQPAKVLGTTAAPASPPPTATTNPSLLTRREREQDPAVVDKTFPVLNESFSPQTLSSSPKPCVEYLHRGCSGGDGSGGGGQEAAAGVHVHSIFTAANRHPTKSKSQKLVRLKDKTKEAIKHGVLHHHHYYGDDSADGSRDEKHGGFISRAASLVSHPRSAIKEKLTGALASQISELNKPHVPQGIEAAFVAAHEKKDEAIECDDIVGVDDADRSIEELEIKRRNMRMGVIMGKHVKKVRALPQKRRGFPRKEEFLIRDERGEVMRDDLGNEQVDYLSWLGQYSIYVTQNFTSHYIEDWNERPEPLCKARLLCHIERIFIASAPWQQWLVHIRDVYRWKDPYETFRWLTLYFILWHTSHVVGFVFGYMIFRVSKNYLFPDTVSSIRDSITRQRTRSLAALRFDQLLSQSGPQALLTSLESDLGPCLQLQLCDLANMLEVINNFSEWHAPRATFFTLCFFISCFVITLFGDMELCMRIIFFILGIVFFFSFPISSYYPKYRYLVSPFKWAFWSVPTNAEWAFAELRLEAQNNRERLIAAKVDAELEPEWEEEGEESDAESFVSAASYGDSPLSGEEQIASFRCRFGRHTGRMYISPPGLRYESGRGKILWWKEWKDLVEVRKVKERGVARLVGGLSEGIELVFLPEFEDREDMVMRLDEMGKRRNEAFSAILGFSGLKWQWCG